MENDGINADPLELEKFSQLAHRWWDPNSEFKPLHEINPLRLNYIDELAGLAGKIVLDVGCGGGILSEGMAFRGVNVTGIDLSDKALKVAKLHLLESAIRLIIARSPWNLSLKSNRSTMMSSPAWKCSNMYPIR